MKRRIILLLTAAFITVPLFSEETVPEYSAGDITSLALQNSPELGMMGKEQELQLLKKKEMQSKYFPTLDFDASFSYLSNPLEPVKLKAGELGSYPFPQGEMMLPPADYVIWEGMENTLYNFKLTMEQPIFTWGKIPAGVSVYDNAAAAKGLQLRKRKNEIRTEILIRLYGLKYAGMIEAVLEEQQELASRMVEIASQSRNQGFLIDADVFDARVEARQINIAEAETYRLIRQSLSRLSRYTGLQDLELSGLDLEGLPAGFEVFPLPDEQFLVEAAMNGNDDLGLLETMKQIGAGRELLAKGSDYLKPDIGLRVEMSYAGPRMPLVETDWFGKDRFNVTASIGLTSRVIDGGELSSRIMYEQRDLEKTALQYEDALSQVREFIVTALTDMKMNRENYEYYNLKASAAGENVKMEKAKLDNNTGSEIDFLKAMIEERKNIIAGYSEMVHYMNSYFQVYAAAGLIDVMEERIRTAG